MNRRIPLPHNLVRTLRRRLGLTQRELAFLLGYKCDSPISRLERGGRVPHFVEVLAMEFVFGISGGEFFNEVRQSTRRSVCARVQQLRTRLCKSGSTHPRVLYKAARLQELLGLLQDQEA